MPQPDYVPLRAADRVRPVERLPVPGRWQADRPADIASIRQPDGKMMGNVGPDQGYGLKLARRFTERLQLQPGEHEEDAVLGGLAVALKRASLFGRAPVIYDFEHAFTLWGFIGVAPPELKIARKALFEAAAHHYENQRAIADAVPESTLQLSPAEVMERIANWRELIDI